MYVYDNYGRSIKYEDALIDKIKGLKKEIYEIDRNLYKISGIKDKLYEITHLRDEVNELKLLLATLSKERGDSDNSKTPDHPIINNNNNESNNDSTTTSKIEFKTSKIESTTSKIESDKDEKIESATSKIESTISKIESDKDEKIESATSKIESTASKIESDKDEKIEFKTSKIESTTSKIESDKDEKIESATSKIESTTSKIESDKDEKIESATSKIESTISKIESDKDEKIESATSKIESTASKIESDKDEKIESTTSKIESATSKIEFTTSKIESDKDEKIESSTSKIESTTSKIESDKDEKNKPIKIINEQEPIYDKRIKYIADALNINYENDIKSYKEKCKLCNPQEYSFVDEAYEEVAKWINWYFEIIKYIIYLKVEQKDLNDVIKVAYKKYDCNPKIIKILMYRFTEITNKINQVNNKYNDMISNLKNYVPEEITENNNYIDKQAIRNEFGPNVQSAFKPFREKLICHNSSFHINTDEIDKYVDKILLHLNRIRLINIYPSSSLLYKKVNTVNKMPIIELIDSIQQPTEDLLFERYKDKLYDNEFLFNNLSFYLNKNSFYDGSFKIII
ncbi:hypothetical protein LY90DRAFT_667305 [Neocallimastix californiae]|uniref:Uncharacterized protein n=1 Tax=Neocallimastix californiae TaxID=1754190 RepID=A0A1Y2EGG0_9FUNG|nr:hypothetical protein LY90DRAFT_667305 [Neocallimastix californiae]|eukprot:ORY70659.1 hypothetical protein LY90DRAFT_667305 [Neocallimastix californiae]